MSMLIVDLDVYTEELEKTLGELHEETPKILQRALTATARAVRKEVNKTGKEKYAYQKFKNSNSGALKVKNGMRQDRFYARLFSVGPYEELINFMVAPAEYAPRSRPNAHKAKVLTSGALKLLGDDPKPFVTKFKSGHIAIVERTSENRLPIRSLLSPSVPSMVKNAGLQEVAEQRARDLINAELPRQISRIAQRTLKKAGRA